MKHYVDQVLASTGAVLPGAIVTVRVANATPGSGALANIYTTDSTASPIAGSFVTTDTLGTFDFYAADGRYDLTVVVGSLSKIVADIEVSDVTESNSGDSTHVATIFNGTTYQVAGVAPTGSGRLVAQVSPTLTTPILGVATATSINKIALTQPATGATITLADNSTLTGQATGTIVNRDSTDTLTNKVYGGTTISSQTFTSNGTFTIPANVKSVKITVVGGGGGGGGSTIVNNGGGGGSGGAAFKWLSGLTPGNTLAITIGAAGAANSGAAGGNGGASSIASGTQVITTVTANGGGGGGTAGIISGGGSAASISTNGDINTGGTSGGDSTAAVSGGPGAPSIFNGGGIKGGTTPGNAASAPGGGGGGAGTNGAGNQAGGAGGTGIVVFEWVT